MPTGHVVVVGFDIAGCFLQKFACFFSFICIYSPLVPICFIWVKTLSEFLINVLGYTDLWLSFVDFIFWLSLWFSLDALLRKV